MKKEFFAIRLEMDIKNRLKKEADEREMSVTDLVREKLHHDIYLSDRITKFLDDFAKGLNFSRSQVLTAIVIDYMARRQAELMTWPNKKRALVEFTRSEDGLLDAEDLYETLLEGYLRKFAGTERLRKMRIALRGKLHNLPDISPEEKEEFMKQLEDEEKALGDA